MNLHDQLTALVLQILVLGQQGELVGIANGALNKASMLKIVRQIDPGEKLIGVLREEQWPFLSFVRRVLTHAGFVRLGSDGTMRPTQAVLPWLQLPKRQRIDVLLQAWLISDFDELTILAGLQYEQPGRRSLEGARREVLQFLAQLPPEEWQDSVALPRAMQVANPSFARAYDAFSEWSVRRITGELLPSETHWMDVEGRLVTEIVFRPLYWLGVIEFNQQSQYRLSAIGRALLAGVADLPDSPPVPIVVQPNFEVVFVRDCSLYAYFQVQRIADLVSAGSEATIMKLTKRRMHAAFERGVALAEIQRLLEEQSGKPLPQNVAKTLQDWAEGFGKLTMRAVALLEADDPALLAQVCHDKRLRMPAATAVHERMLAIDIGDAVPLLERLRKAGYGASGELRETHEGWSERDLAVIYTALEFYHSASRLLDIEDPVRTGLRQRVRMALSQRMAERAHQQAAAAAARLEELIDDA
jgi:hypothetical protein